MDLVIIFLAKYLSLISLMVYLVFGFALWRTNIQKFKYFLIFSLFSFLLTYFVGKILGFVISDPRPFVVEHSSPLVDHVADNGFPSAHTLITVVIASIVFAYNKKLGILLFVIALIVGITRLLASIIHPVDIVGATLIGISITTFIFLLVTLYTLYNDDPLDLDRR
jgi:undecaprenyl-diphosphatase